MNRLLHTLCLSCAIAGTPVMAQLTINPNPVTILNIDVNQFETVAYSTVTNTSGIEKNLVWVRNVVSITQGWESAICDLNLCHFNFVNQANFVLGAESSGAMDVHIYPYGIEGAAIIEVLVYNQNDFSESVTGMYYFNTSLSTPERITENLKIYPNPTVDYVRISSAVDVHRVEIYNMDGRIVDNLVLAGKDRLELAHYPKGTYIVRMLGLQNEVRSTNIVLKQ